MDIIPVVVEHIVKPINQPPNQNLFFASRRTSFAKSLSLLKYHTVTSDLVRMLVCLDLVTCSIELQLPPSLPPSSYQLRSKKKKLYSPRISPTAQSPPLSPFPLPHPTSTIQHNTFPFTPEYHYPPTLQTPPPATTPPLTNLPP